MKNSPDQASGNSAEIQTKMMIKIGVFDGESSVDQVLGYLIEGDGSAAFFGVKFVEKLAVPVIDKR